MKTVNDYELLDHGIHYPDYFQGCGVCLTDFTDVATGIGETPKEAIDDALESLAQNNWDADTLEARMLKDENRKEWPDKPCANEDMPIDADEYELKYYHVSIRVK